MESQANRRALLCILCTYGPKPKAASEQSVPAFRVRISVHLQTYGFKSIRELHSLIWQRKLTSAVILLIQQKLVSVSCKAFALLAGNFERSNNKKNPTSKKPNLSWQLIERILCLCACLHLDGLLKLMFYCSRVILIFITVKCLISALGNMNYLQY